MLSGFLSLSLEPLLYRSFSPHGVQRFALGRPAYEVTEMRISIFGSLLTPEFSARLSHA